MKALLVIDMQNDICHDLRRSHLVKAMLAPLKGLIEKFSAAKLPVFYACFSLKGTTSSSPVLATVTASKIRRAPRSFQS